jgi:hypothetical protein
MGEPFGVVVAFSAGVFSFLSPCVLSLLPSYFSFVTGMSVSDLSGDLTSAARRASSPARRRCLRRASKPKRPTGAARLAVGARSARRVPHQGPSCRRTAGRAASRARLY